MWGCFFTKPLQGSKFRRFRSVVLVNSRANEPSPPMRVLDPEDVNRAENIGDISKFVGSVHVHSRKVKIRVNG